jgi:hypothetical protein
MARPKLEDRPSTVDRSGRPSRTPINGSRDKLTVQGQEAGWHYCWVNDDNVAKYEAAGYEFVTHDVVVGEKSINTASQVGGKVSMAVGNQVTAYLMRVLQEYYDEDMQAVQDDLDEKEAAMHATLNSGKDGQYGEVWITRGKNN